MKTLKRTWADISLDNLEYNYRSIRAHLPSGTRFLGVMKADAYGHGAVPVSRALADLGAEYLLVDGYNIIFAWDALKKLAAQDVAAAREALAGILANYRGWRRCEIILVFDAYKVKGNPGSMEKKNGIYIVYTKEAQTADSYIERATYDLGKNHRVRVATSDNMEQVIILGHGALRISARAFEEEVAEAEGQISDLIERWNVRDFDLRRVRATATIIDKKEEKGS